MDKTKFYQYCLQGDIVSAFDYLCSFPNKDKELQELEFKYYQRFFSIEPVYCYKSEDPWIRKVLLAYYQYFSAVLTRKSVDEAEKCLIASLGKLIPENSNHEAIERIEEELKYVFKEKGYTFLGGITPPFRGPYIWKTTEKREFTVELPDRVQKVTVYFLSDFILQSWVHFATFGEKFAAGWAKPDGLYYVADRPECKRVDLDSSVFQVSYLKHEAQHQCDFERFPNLRPRDLEYRAKLVELIFESDSSRLLEKFFHEQKDDPFHPHSYSSFVIMKRLSQMVFGTTKTSSLGEWMNIDSSKIQDWARILFEEHTKQLEACGKGVSGSI